MQRRTRRRWLAAAAGVSSLAVVLSGCSSDSDGETDASVDCSQFTKYGDLTGTRVTVYTSIVAPEDQPHIDSYKPFEQCTHADIVYEGSKEFEAQLKVRVKAGNPPDIAFIPQPGLLGTLVRDDKAVITAPPETSANVDEYFGADWKAYGTVDGTFYAAPLGANVKSFVWYSPKAFADKGWTVPTTLDQLKELSSTIAGTGIKPWCVGIGSGDATGWPLTDWMEDFMLRMEGSDVYDDWVSHRIPFNDSRVAAVLNAVGDYTKNDQMVNGGLGDTRSVASTTFQDGGIPILSGQCALHRQASFYAANFSPAGATISDDATKDNNVWAFYLPAVDDSTHPTLGGGEFVAAFRDAPEVKAFQTFLSSPEWANQKAKDTPGGGWVTANTGADPNLFNGIDRLSVDILQDPLTEFRFDGSDLMPAAVGQGTFWKGMTDWQTGQSTQATLDFIEQSWPK